MSELFRSGSEDQVFGTHWDADHMPPIDEDHPDCDSGMSADCTGRATTKLYVEYLCGDPLVLCLPCLRLELRRAEDGPTDSAISNGYGVEGGIRYDRTWEQR